MNFKDRTLSIGSGAEEAQIKLAEFMIQFLQQTLQPFDEQNNYGANIVGGSRYQSIGSSSMTILVKCFDIESYFN